MAYTPELSYEASSTLRRIAWSMNKPMTKTMEWILTDLVKIIPSGAICEACKDKSKCETCPFNTDGRPTLMEEQNVSTDEFSIKGKTSEVRLGTDSWNLQFSLEADAR